VKHIVAELIELAMQSTSVLREEAQRIAEGYAPPDGRDLLLMEGVSTIQAASE
jgi:hypothetical protein